jgi:hypothetical protein
MIVILVSEPTSLIILLIPSFFELKLHLLLSGETPGLEVLKIINL